MDRTFHLLHFELLALPDFLTRLLSGRFDLKEGRVRSLFARFLLETVSTVVVSSIDSVCWISPPLVILAFLLFLNFEDFFFIVDALFSVCNLFLVSLLSFSPFSFSLGKKILNDSFLSTFHYHFVTKYTLKYSFPKENKNF